MLLFWCLAICGRLVYLQIFRYGSFVKQAEHQQQRGFDVSANRGVILRPRGARAGDVDPGGFGVCRSPLKSPTFPARSL